MYLNIRPGTIITFQDDTSDRLGPSFLIGFERIRRAEGRTDKFGDLDWEKNLYRHPLRQGLQPEEIFEMRHDIYSLGVCPLEIALWESFVNLDSRGQLTPWSGLNITAALQDTDQRRGAFAVKERLVDMAKDALPSLVGERFTGIVLACLCCLDQSVDNALWDPKELQDRDGIVVGVKYIENSCSHEHVNLCCPSTEEAHKYVLPCWGNAVTTTVSFVYSYTAYSAEAPCYGFFIVDGNIGSSPDICEAPKNNFAIDQCGTDMTFINEGPEFFSGCGFQLEITGKKYTPRRLDPLDENTPCSGRCDLSSITGLLLYEDLPQSVGPTLSHDTDVNAAFLLHFHDRFLSIGSTTLSWGAGWARLS
ncbi:hypothetical protein BJX96DRAFT_173135 [Aspergillus floccosus]